MAQVTYRGVKYNTNDSRNCQKQVSELTYRGIKHTEEKVVCAKWVTDLQLLEEQGVDPALFLYYNYWERKSNEQGKTKSFSSSS